MSRLARVALAMMALAVVLPLQAGGTMARVKKIVSGNTLVVDLRGQETTIHLYGIASADPEDKRPAVKKLATQAQEFLREYLKSGWVYLEFPGGQPKPDKDGVMNAFAYRDRDAAFINEKLVAEGLGVVNEQAEGEMKDRFLARQKEARLASHGIWGQFLSGDPKKIAAGEGHQGTYIGEAPDKKYGYSYGYYNPDYLMNEVLYWLRRSQTGY
ncbi:MAG TPA: thermonuclease family protein [Thermoanaerobaculia bacterium]